MLKYFNAQHLTYLLHFPLYLHLHFHYFFFFYLQHSQHLFFFSAASAEGCFGLMRERGIEGCVWTAVVMELPRQEKQSKTDTFFSLFSTSFSTSVVCCCISEISILLIFFFSVVVSNEQILLFQNKDNKTMLIISLFQISFSCSLNFTLTTLQLREYFTTEKYFASF